MSQVVGLDMVTGMGSIGLEPGRLYKIEQSPKLKDQTASGNPLHFGANDIWAGISQEATKTDGMARIPAGVAQVVGSNVNSVWPGMTFDTLHVLSDNAETNTVEIQPVQW